MYKCKMFEKLIKTNDTIIYKPPRIVQIFRTNVKENGETEKKFFEGSIKNSISEAFDIRANSRGDIDEMINFAKKTNNLSEFEKKRTILKINKKEASEMMKRCSSLILFNEKDSKERENSIDSFKNILNDLRDYNKKVNYQTTLNRTLYYYQNLKNKVNPAFRRGVTGNLTRYIQGNNQYRNFCDQLKNKIKDLIDSSSEITDITDDDESFDCDESAKSNIESIQINSDVCNNSFNFDSSILINDVYLEYMRHIISCIINLS